MSTDFVTGDLFDGVDTKRVALAHGVNLQGAFGAGVALQIRQRWPWAYAVYKDNFDVLVLGKTLVATCDYDRLVVIHCATQPRPGRCADKDSIQVSVAHACAIAESYGHHTLRIPWIGCGLGGLDIKRDNMREMFVQIGELTRVRLAVYTLPEVK